MERNYNEKRGISVLNIPKVREQLLRDKETQTELVKFENEQNLEFSEQVFNRYGKKVYVFGIDYFSPANIVTKQDKELFLKAYILNPLTQLSFKEDIYSKRLHVLVESKHPENNESYWIEDIPVGEVSSIFLNNILELLRYKNFLEECPANEKDNVSAILNNKITRYNNLPVIVQARYFEISRYKTLPEMESIGEFSEEVIREILDDYSHKIKNRILYNFQNIKAQFKEIDNQSKGYYEAKAHLILQKVINGMENGDDGESFMQSIIDMIKSIDQDSGFRLN